MTEVDLLRFFARLVGGQFSSNDEAESATEAVLTKWRRLETERDALRAEAGRLREFIEEVAGGDCYQYDKFLNPKPCGTCQSCHARAVLSLRPAHTESR